MLSLVPQIEQIWKNRRSELEDMGKELKEQIGNQIQLSETKNNLMQLNLMRHSTNYSWRLIMKMGVFGSAPKFPSPHNLLFLLRYYNRTKQKAA